MEQPGLDLEVGEGGDRFGELAAALKLVTVEQVRAGLELQAQQRKAGQQKRLGETLVAEHVLNLRAVQKVLVEQERRRKKTRGPGSELPAKIFGTYELLERLGAGGMGEVYKARDPKMDRIVALKVLNKQLAHDQKFVERFKREIRATGALNHPHIVTAFGAGEVNGQLYLAVEFVEGQTLHQLVKRRGRLPEREALTLIRGVAAGLQHAHDNGFIHRDVKPDNLLLGRDGRVKLADLGLAKSIEDDQRLTRTGTAIGTPHYISPEQAQGQKDVDHRSDIYSLGATLYVALTGTRPFDGKNNAEIMLKHLQEELENPQDVVPEISDGAVEIISRMMAKRPQDRYQHCGELIADLDRVLEAKGEVVLQGPQVESSIRAPKRRKRRAAGRARTGPGGAGCLVLLCLGAGLVALAIRWGPGWWA